MKSGKVVVCPNGRVFDLYAKIRLDTDDYTNALNDASHKTSTFGEKIGAGLKTAAKVGAAAIAAATTAVAGFAASSVKTGMGFDSAMSQVAATMSMTMDQLNNAVETVQLSTGEFTGTLREFAIEMSSNTAFSANEVAEALNYMALAGYDIKTSMSMLPNVLNLAAAGNMDLARASDALTDSQTALGLTIDETTVLSDQWARTASRTNTSVAQLAEATLTVGGTAKGMSGGITELNSVLGILADNSIKGADGGVHLRNILLAMNPTTKAAKQAFKDLGIETYDSQENLRSLSDIFLDLNAAMADMTEQEKDVMKSAIFNKTDLSAVNALLGTTAERWEEVYGAISDATGAAEEMAKVQLDNLAGDVVYFKSALEAAKIILSDQLTPNLREFVQFGTNAISTLSEAFKEGGLSGAMEALGTILSDGLNMVIEQLPKFIDAGMQLLGALGRGILDNLPMITDAALEIVFMLSDGIVSALPSLAEGAIQIVSELATGIGNAAPELVPKAVEAILQFVDGLTNPESMKNLLGAALTLIEGLGEGIIKSIPLLIKYGPEIVVNIVSGIMSALPQLLEVGWQLIVGLGEGILQGLAVIPDTIARVAGAIVDGFKALFGIHSPSTVMAEMGDNLIAGLLQGISDTWQSIVDFFAGAGEALINLLGGVWDTISGAASAAWEAIGSVVSGAWDTITGVWNAATGFFGGIWESVQSTAGSAADAIGGFLSDAWDAISSVWQGAFDFYAGIWSDIISVFSGAFGEFSGIGGNIVEGIKNGISNAWKSLTSMVSGLFGGLIKSVKSTLGIASPSKVFAGIGGNMALGLGEGWDDEYASIKQKIESGMDFGFASVGLTANATYSTNRTEQDGAQSAFSGGGNTYVTINSPVAVDAVTAAREWKKTTQRMAMGYV